MDGKNMMKMAMAKSIASFLTLTVLAIIVQVEKFQEFSKIFAELFVHGLAFERNGNSTLFFCMIPQHAIHIGFRI